MGLLRLRLGRFVVLLLRFSFMLVVKLIGWLCASLFRGVYVCCFVSFLWILYYYFVLNSEFGWWVCFDWFSGCDLWGCFTISRGVVVIDSICF